MVLKSIKPFFFKPRKELFNVGLLILCQIIQEYLRIQQRSVLLTRSNRQGVSVKDLYSRNRLTSVQNYIWLWFLNCLVWRIQNVFIPIWCRTSHFGLYPNPNCRYTKYRYVSKYRTGGFIEVVKIKIVPELSFKGSFVVCIFFALQFHQLPCLELEPEPPIIRVSRVGWLAPPHCVACSLTNKK